MSLRPQSDVQATCAAMGQLRLPCQWGGPRPARCLPLGARPWQQPPADFDDNQCVICFVRLTPVFPQERPRKQQTQAKATVTADKRKRDEPEPLQPLDPETRRVVELSCGHRFHMDTDCLLPYIARQYVKAVDTRGREGLKCPVCSQIFARVTEHGVESTYENPSELEELMSSWARIGVSESPVKEYETWRSQRLKQLQDYNSSIKQYPQILNHSEAASDFRSYLHKKFHDADDSVDEEDHVNRDQLTGSDDERLQQLYSMEQKYLEARVAAVTEAFADVPKERSLFNDLSIVLELVKAGVNSESIRDYTHYRRFVATVPSKVSPPFFLECVPCSQWSLQPVQDTLLKLATESPESTTIPAGLLAHTPMLQRDETFVEFVIRRIPVGHRGDVDYINTNGYTPMYKFSPFNTSVGAAFVFADNAVVLNQRVHRLGLERDGMALKFLPYVDRNNITSVLVAVQQNGLALQYAANSPRSAFGVVRTAVRKNGLALQYASLSLRQNRSVVLAAVQNDGMALQFTTNDIQRDRSVVLAALQTSGRKVLAFAGKELMDDRDFQLDVVTRDPGAVLAFGHDRELWLKAVEGTRADDRFQGVNDLLDDVQETLAKGDRQFAWVLADYEIMEMAIGHNPENLSYADSRLKNDPTLVMKAVKDDAMALAFAGDIPRANYDVVLAAVTENGMALQFASDILKSNYEIILAALRQKPEAERYADWETLKKNQPERFQELAITFDIKYGTEPDSTFTLDDSDDDLDGGSDEDNEDDSDDDLELASDARVCSNAATPQPRAPLAPARRAAAP